MELTQALVEQIVDLVLREIVARREGLGCAPAQRITAVFCGGMSGAEEGRRALRGLTDRGYPVKVLFTPQAERINGEVWLREQAPKVQILPEQYGGSPQALIDDTDLLLIPVLTCNSAAKLACGMAENTALSAVLFAMMAGKTVIAADDACKGRAGSPATVHILEKNLLTLKRCGIRFIPACRLEEQTVQRLERVPQGLPGPACRLEGRVLSVSQICGLHGGTIVVPRDTIITPAAADEAKKRNIELKRDSSWER